MTQTATITLAVRSGAGDSDHARTRAAGRNQARAERDGRTPERPAPAASGFHPTDTVTVSAPVDRKEPAKAASPSWFVAGVNPVTRILGALLICLPMFASLDVVSAATAFGLELALLWVGGVAPWTVFRRTWPVWIAAAGSFVSVLLYGKTGGDVLWQAGWIVVSQNSAYLACATFLRVAAIAVPGVILALGLDPTDLADGLVQIARLSPRFVYGALAGMRMFTLLQDDWRALGLSRRSRGLGDGNAVRRACSQAFGLLVLSIRRATRLATAMEARGFGGEGERGHARVSSLHARDAVFCLICLAIPCVAMGLSIVTGSWRFSFHGA